MQDEQKKLLIVGLLFVVMLGVGVFQFQKLSPAPQSAPSTSSSHHVLPTNDATKVATSPLLNPPALAERDPFAPPVKFAGLAPAGAEPQPIAKLDRPVEPMKGDVLPAAMSTTALVPDPKSAGPQSVPAAASQPKPPVVPPFSYRLTGVMLGAKPLAFEKGGLVERG